MSERWAICVTWADGTQEYLQFGVAPGRIATFSSRSRADEQAEFMRDWMEGDDVQSIAVVVAP